MPLSPYDISIRETLQNNRKVGLSFAAILCLCALGISSYYLWPNREKPDPTKIFYSDDDGQSYFKDSIYKFPPFDHGGKTAVGAVVGESAGHGFVAYLRRYTPEAQKQLRQKYNEAIKDNLSVQETVINFMSRPEIGLQGVEIKLPGPNHAWLPLSQAAKLDIAAPNGQMFDRSITP